MKFFHGNLKKKLPEKIIKTPSTSNNSFARKMIYNYGEISNLMEFL